MALPIRSRARTSGRFSNREIVDCEHNSRSEGDRSSAILNMGSPRSELASSPSSYPALIISRRMRSIRPEKPKTNDVSQAVRDLIGRARINHAAGKPIGDPKLLFDIECRHPKTAGPHQI